MKKLLVLLALSALMASAAFAQADPDPDGISVYFDLEATQTCTVTTANFEQVFAYLMITNPSRGGVSGWEVNVTTTGGFTAPSWATEAGADLGGDASGAFQEFFVGIGPSPLALMGSVVHVATFSCYVFSPADVVEFFIEPYTTSSIPENPAPCYTDPIEVGIIVPLQVASGSYELPVAQVNACTVVETEARSWGGVKALF